MHFLKIRIFSLLLCTYCLALAPAYADFYDTLSGTDPNASLWTITNDASNGYPYDTCWKNSQFERVRGIGIFSLITSSLCIPGETTLGAQYLSTNFYGYGTYSFSIQAPSLTAGVVMGALLYRGYSDLNKRIPEHNEIAIQFLKGGVQFNYFHNNIDGHALFLDPKELNFNPGSDFHTYSFSWQPGVIKFLIDGHVKATQTTDIPRIEEGGMQIIINLWRCLDTSWCGVAPSPLKTTALLDWVKYTSP